MSACFVANRALLVVPTKSIVMRNSGNNLLVQSLCTAASKNMIGLRRRGLPTELRRKRREQCQHLYEAPLLLRGAPKLYSGFHTVYGKRRLSNVSLQQQPSELTTKLSVSGGMIAVSLPLPGLPGLTNVGVPADAPVRRLVKELKSLDNRLTEVEVSNADGHKLAQSTPVGDVAGRGLFLSFGGRPRIRVVNEASGHSTQEVLSPDLYPKLKAEITNAGRITIKREELDAFCAKVCKEAGSRYIQANTLDPMLAEGWLNALVEDGLVFTADKGRVVLLNPSGPGVSDEIANALRRDDELVDSKVSMLREKLDAMYVEERRLQDIRDKLIAKVYRNVTLKKGAVLTFMFAQFGTLAYCVYELYSWDVMEPATYFLMLSYSVGSSLYFAANNREASYNNLMDEALKRREAKLKPALGYSRSGHARLKQEIMRCQEGVELLSSHRDAHPPVDPIVSPKNLNI